MDTSGEGRRFSAENGLPALAWAKRLSQDVPTKRPDLKQTRPISTAELNRHNKKDDCWIALRGTERRKEIILSSLKPRL